MTKHQEFYEDLKEDALHLYEYLSLMEHKKSIDDEKEISFLKDTFEHLKYKCDSYLVFLTVLKFAE